MDHQEARGAGEFVGALRHDLNDQLFGDDFPGRATGSGVVAFFDLQDGGGGAGCVQSLKRLLLGLLDLPLCPAFLFAVGDDSPPRWFGKAPGGTLGGGRRPRMSSPRREPGRGTVSGLLGCGT